MLTTAGDLEALTRVRSGSLAEIPFPCLLWALARHRRTAVLEIRRGPIKKDIIFEDGIPVDCRSNLVHETLGRFMVGLGRLSEEDYNSCLREAAAHGVQLGEVLRERGLIGSGELFRVLQQNLAKKLLDGFTWREGEFQLVFEVPEVDSPLKVRVPQLIVTGMSRFSPQEQVDAAVGPLVGRRLALHPAPPVSLEEIRLSPVHAALVGMLDTPRRLDQLAEVCQVPFDEINRLVAALLLLGVVLTEDRLKEAAARPARHVAPASPSRPARPAGAGPGDGRTPAEIEDDLMQAYLAHRRKDALDLLGVAPEAPPGEARIRFFEFARRYAPWRFAGTELEGLTEKAEDLFIAGARALAELLDSEQRNTLLYRRRVLAEEKQRQGASQPGIETDLLDPEKQYRKGRALADEGKLREALMLLEFAADCDPQNALYRAEAAWCRYLLHPAGGADRALSEVEEALRIDPGCGVATLYAGELKAEISEWDTAESLLRRANQLLAPDRRPIEALKNLQRRRKKR